MSPNRDRIRIVAPLTMTKEQEEASCLCMVCCAYMLLVTIYGEENIQWNDLVNRMVPSSTGCTFGELTQVLNEMKISHKIYTPVTEDIIYTSLCAGFPVIVGTSSRHLGYLDHRQSDVDAPKNPGGESYRHVVIVCGLDTDKDHVYYFDPDAKNHLLDERGHDCFYTADPTLRGCLCENTQRFFLGPVNEKGGYSRMFRFARRTLPLLPVACVLTGLKGRERRLK